MFQYWTKYMLTSQFGITMGGIWGLAVSMSLENMPVEARGLFSGFLQLGYPVGYLIIAAVNLNPYIQKQQHWRVLFYTGAGMSLLAAVIRLLLPESAYFKERQQRRAELEADGAITKSATMTTLRELGKTLRVHWARCVWSVIFMRYVDRTAASTLPADHPSAFVS